MRVGAACYIIPDLSNSPLLKSCFDQAGSAATVTTRMANALQDAATRMIAAAFSVQTKHRWASARAAASLGVPAPISSRIGCRGCARRRGPGWDTATTATELSDYSVCTTWERVDNEFYLLDVFRQRLNYPDLKRKVKERADQHRPHTILIEDKASGTQLIQDLRAEGLYAIKAYEPPQGTDKIMRLHAQTAIFENGRVLLPRHAPWLADYITELTSFPGARHDDQVASTTQAPDHLREMTIWRASRQTRTRLENDLRAAARHCSRSTSFWNLAADNCGYQRPGLAEESFRPDAEAQIEVAPRHATERAA